MSKTPPGMPRWVKVFVFIALALAALFVVLHLSGAGPRGHALPAGAGGQPAAIEQRLPPP